MFHHERKTHIIGLCLWAALGAAPTLLSEVVPGAGIREYRAAKTSTHLLGYPTQTYGVGKHQLKHSQRGNYDQHSIAGLFCAKKIGFSAEHLGFNIGDRGIGIFGAI